MVSRTLTVVARSSVVEEGTIVTAVAGSSEKVGGSRTQFGVPEPLQSAPCISVHGFSASRRVRSAWKKKILKSCNLTTRLRQRAPDDQCASGCRAHDERTRPGAARQHHQLQGARRALLSCCWFLSDARRRDFSCCGMDVHAGRCRPVLVAVSAGTRYARSDTHRPTGKK